MNTTRILELTLLGAALYISGSFISGMMEAKRQMKTGNIFTLGAAYNEAGYIKEKGMEQYIKVFSSVSIEEFERKSMGDILEAISN